MNRYVWSLFAAAALGGALAGCSDSTDSGGTIPPGDGTLSGNIATNRTLAAETTYTISGFVKVQSGATLTIPAGTKLVGDTTVPGSSLWILRGAKLIAEGTASSPIVFTSARSAGNRKPGDWGGIIIVGNGVINRTAATVLTEGSAAGQAENYAGGNDNTDNSGSLRYVRIEFAGFDVSNGGGQELNSLSMYAVGSGTRIEYVQTLAGLDDSFEWWGGAVNTRYLISTESGDDHFDWTEGHRGAHQFLIGYQSTRLTPVSPAVGTLSTDPRGFEGDGCDPNPATAPDCQYVGGAATPTDMNTPYSGPVFGNVTLIGPRNAVAGFPADGNGAVLRRGTGVRIDRSIIAGWPGKGINGRDRWTDSLRLRDSLSITNVVLGDNAGGDYDGASCGGPTDPSSAGAANALFCASMFAGSNHITGATVGNLITTLPSGTSIGDFRPPAGSPAASVGTAAATTRLLAQVASYPYSGGWATTGYVGAADPAGSPWWTGWTNYGTN
jgi:hypothetical protein